MPSSHHLLADDEPPAALVERPAGSSPFFLVCDHASARIPRRLENLGLSAEDRARHIAWDIGALAVAQALSAQLDACLVSQGYSRLVIDCNRPPGTPQSIPVVSERTRIAANESLPPAEKTLREEAIFRPYHAAIEAELDARAARGQPTVLVSVHSFTPTYLDVGRRWHTGVLYQRDPRLGRSLLRALRASALDGTPLVVGDNEPYAVSAETDYAVPVHGEQRGIAHVGIEIRQDLIGEPAGQATWARLLGEALTASLPDVLANERAADPTSRGH